MNDLVKVFFAVDQDEDGFPPVASESVWASTTPTQGEYIVDNIPFLARQATLGDTVLVRISEGALWFDRLVKRSGNSLIRVVFFDKNALEATRAALASMGCNAEFSHDLNLLAVNIPSSTPLREVQAYLQRATDQGTLDYEEPILRQD